ncbi:hypothetical protein [Nocardioides sp. LHG3406-4]|uniref:hypothetical protein n=1 Tax=Nocardioides sp. LHG3406-4 TaxID=2804575 RepID=UPI003CFBA074
MTETASTTTTPTIHIPGDAFQEPILEFVRQSALTLCTSGGRPGDTDTRGDDSIAITALWDVATFSAGEAAQWRILESLTTGDLRTVLDRCDTRNVRALINVITHCAAVKR